MTRPPADKPLTSDEAAAALRISRRTLDRLCAAGEITFMLYGSRSRRFERSDLEAFKQRARDKAGEPKKCLSTDAEKSSGIAFSGKVVSFADLAARR